LRNSVIGPNIGSRGRYGAPQQLWIPLMARSALLPLSRLAGRVAQAQPSELRGVMLAFSCNFILLASYYILRPLRDTMATVFGVAQLQDLFTGTFVITLVCAPIFAWSAANIRLTRLLPGVFWFLLLDLLLFYGLFRTIPGDRWTAAAFYLWFSVVNLFLISIFWTLMADTFSPDQATRLFAFIAAGGSVGAIFGPIITTAFVRTIGIAGLLLMACAGFLIVIVLVHLLMREKTQLQKAGTGAQGTTLDHNLPGNPLRGFTLLFQSRYLLGQAGFFLLMTWVATLLYFLQADFVARTYSAVESRAIAFADVDLFVNICSAVILILGQGWLLRRFGVTFGLVLSPILMAGAFVVLALAPTFLVVQSARALQRISQYAVARPSREILFTVVDQQSRYKAKNVIDTSVYRFGDLTAAWMQAGLRGAGFGLLVVAGFGALVAVAWGIVALLIGRRYQMLAGRAQAAIIERPMEV
jgi:AAA family ATP:ADP antiporter